MALVLAGKDYCDRWSVVYLSFQQFAPAWTFLNHGDMEAIEKSMEKQQQKQAC